MKKIQYETDPHNRLVIAGSGKKSGLPKFRQVIDGRFKIDEKNDLSYRVKAPLPKDETPYHSLPVSYTHLTLPTKRIV